MAIGIVNGQDKGFKLNNLEPVSRQIRAGETVKAGDLVDFVSNQVRGLPLTPTRFVATDYVGLARAMESDIIEISDGKLLYVYTNESTYYLWAQLVMIDANGVITKGTPISLTNFMAADVKASLVDTDKVIISFTNNSVSYEYNAIALSISDTTLTAGTKIVIETTRRGNMQSFKCDTNKIIITFNDQFSPGYLYLYVVSVSGLTLTKSASASTYANYSGKASGVMLSPGRTILMVPYYNGSTWSLRVILLTVTGLSISYSTALTIGSNIPYKIQYPLRISDNKVFVGAQGYTCIVDVSTGTPQITVSHPILIAEVDSIDKALIMDNKLYIYYKGSSPYYGHLIVHVFTDNTFTTLKYSADPITLTPVEHPNTTRTLKVRDGLIACFNKGDSTNSYRQPVLPLIKFEASNLAYTKGLMVENGVGGETKKVYKWL